jgi:hypothetical protein
MAEAYIVEAVRTAGGRRNGKLAGWHPADMAAETLNAVVERSGIDPAAVEDVILGCVTQAGEQAFAFGRNAVLASRLPETVPAVTIDRQCGSSQLAVQFAAQAPASSSSVQRARPSGGLEQAVATSRASSLLVSLRSAPARGSSFRAASRLPSTKRRLVL